MSTAEAYTCYFYWVYEIKCTQTDALYIMFISNVAVLDNIMARVSRLKYVYLGVTTHRKIDNFIAIIRSSSEVK